MYVQGYTMLRIELYTYRFGQSINRSIGFFKFDHSQSINRFLWIWSRSINQSVSLNCISMYSSLDLQLCFNSYCCIVLFLLDELDSPGQGNNSSHSPLPPTSTNTTTNQLNSSDLNDSVLRSVITYIAQRALPPIRSLLWQFSLV